jgi:hypothetical protein
MSRPIECDRCERVVGDYDRDSLMDIRSRGHLATPGPYGMPDIVCAACLALVPVLNAELREYHVLGRFTVAEQQEVMAANEAEAVRIAREKCGRTIEDYERVTFEVIG